MDAKEFLNMYKDHGYSPKHITKKISDHEYAGVFIYQLIRGPKPDEIHVTWYGDNVLNLANVENAFPWDWSFQLPLHALEGKTQVLTGAGIHSEANGIDVTLTKMSKTPVSTTFYLSEQVDVRKAATEDEEFRFVGIEYTVTDNLGNEYNMLHYSDTGHSTDFKQSHVSFP